jgi:signal transduction histidine kinase
MTIDLAPHPITADGGECGRLLRTFDWSTTALGAASAWPSSLCAALNLVLESGFPLVVACGAEFRYLYNDAYRPVLGAKHPGAMGKAGAEIFPEAWDRVKPLFERTRAGEAVAVDDVYMPLEKAGYLEDCWFSFSLSPIRDEARAVIATLAIVADTTMRVEGQRRISTLRVLAQQAAGRDSVEQVCRAAAAACAQNTIDLPFALFYAIDHGDRRARLVAAAGLEAGARAAPLAVPLDDADADCWMLGRVAASGMAATVELDPDRCGHVRCGPHAESPDRALVLPLAKPGAARPYGMLVAGANPRRAIDASYRAFFELVADQVTGAIASAQAFEQERHRAEALVAIDREKTAFFSNVSHELRTPLTLMLSPTEDLLAGGPGPLTELQQEYLATVHRNALRLLRLVNNLLDFARIESGRIEACYEPTDLAKLTTELASGFRSAIERAGLELRVDCPPLGEPIYVDHDLWERIVLNLLSNAFKFTFDGRILLSQHLVGDRVELRVSDTGIGIAAEQLPHLFERFHRVQGARSRSNEGSGIGLALVGDLIKLHGGQTAVESTPGAGTTFVISLPRGHAHLPAAQVGGTRSAHAPLRRDAFVEDASRWPLDGATPTPGVPPVPKVPREEAPDVRPSVLVVDDNADMRAYLTSILSIDHAVESVETGAPALEAIRRRPPDLVLSDSMMPGLDGRELLRELRADPATCAIPVILLSARAGETAIIEGLAAGADDYLEKPFSARELRARVQTRIEMASIRRQVALHEGIETELREAMQLRDSFLALASHELRTPLTTLGLQLDGLLRMLKEVPASIAPVLIQKAERVRTQADRVEQLVETMLDMFALAGGKLELHPIATDLGDVAREIVQRFRRESKTAAARLELRAVGVEGHWDRQRLDQLLSKLIENALKFGDGKPVDVVVEAADADARIVVRDHGIGIAACDQERIFERFERGVTADHYAGFGLGLWMARGLATAMGGRIRVDSEPGCGATFEVTLPRQP